MIEALVKSGFWAGFWIGGNLFCALALGATSGAVAATPNLATVFVVAWIHGRTISKAKHIDRS